MRTPAATAIAWFSLAFIVVFWTLHLTVGVW
jgi:hypothetical protein